MKKLLAGILAAIVLPAFAPAVQAQNLDDIFRKVSPSVVVVRSKGRDVEGKEIPVGGDIILAVDGIPVVSEDNIEKIRNRLAGGAPGTPFKMSVLRAGKVIDLTGTMQ